jgi:hypothetical protein
MRAILFSAYLVLMMTNTSLSQRFGLGVYSGRETSHIPFKEIYNYNYGFSNISFNQAILYKWKFGLSFNFNNLKRIQNRFEIGLTHMAGFNVMLASDDKLQSGFYAKGDYFGTREKLIPYFQLRNDFSFVVYKLRGVALAANIKIGYQIIQHKKQQKGLQDFNQNIEDYTGFQMGLTTDFYNSNLINVANYFTLDYGFEFRYRQLGIGFSTGFSISELGKETCFGRLNRIELALNYELVSKSLELDKNENEGLGKKEQFDHRLENSLNHLYVKIVQPVNYWMSFDSSGVYGSNMYENQSSYYFGIAPYYNSSDAYDITKITASPEYSYLPGLSVGIHLENRASFFGEFELGYAYYKMTFKNSNYFLGDTQYGEIYSDMPVVLNSFRDEQVKRAYIFAAANLYGRFRLIKRYNLLAGVLFSFGMTPELPHYDPYSSVGYTTYGYWFKEVQKPVLYPSFFNGLVGAKIGVEKAGIILEAQQTMTVNSFFLNTTPIGFGRLFTTSVALKIPVYKLSTRQR